MKRSRTQKMAYASTTASLFSLLLAPPFMIICSIVFFLGLTTTVSAVEVPSPTEYKVGKTGVWRIPDADNPDVYNQWASLYRFRVGDSIYFHYKDDSVFVVDKNGYYHCNTTDPISSGFNDDGKTVIKLDAPGPIYIISGAPEHCKHGQRMIIKVMGIRIIPPSPPSISEPCPPSSPTTNSNSAGVQLISIGFSPISMVACTLLISGALL